MKLERKVLRFRIYSYNVGHEHGEPYMIEYEEKIEVDYSKSLYLLIEETVDTYVIKNEYNLANLHYYIPNITELLWQEYFDPDFSNMYLLRNKHYKYSYLDLPIGDLDRQFHICNKEIRLAICPFGLGASVGETNGIKFYFHTNEKDIHHRPHIHCKSGSEEFRIDLENLNPLDKTFKSKQKTKFALELVGKNQANLLNYWNKVVIDGEALKFEVEY